MSQIEWETIEMRAWQRCHASHPRAAQAAAATGAPFVCLSGGAAAAAALAAAAGGSVLDAAFAREPTAEAAREAAGVRCQVLNLHGDFAQVVGRAATRRVLGVAGGAAAGDLAAALQDLRGRLVAGRDGDDGGGGAAAYDEARVRAALESEGALLRSCAVFDCAVDGDLFPLHPVGTTLGEAAPPARAG